MLLYADLETDSIRATVETVERRRILQTEYNAANGIVPRTILKPVRDGTEALYEMDYVEIADYPGPLCQGSCRLDPPGPCTSLLGGAARSWLSVTLSPSASAAERAALRAYLIAWLDAAR